MKIVHGKSDHALYIHHLLLFTFPMGLVGWNLCASNYSSFSMIQLPPNMTGPESVAFNFLGGGPYVGVADGRILKWLGLGFGFVEFAATSPKRTCDGTTDPDLGPICRRPPGLSFNYATGELYIVDAYFGLQVVGFRGGLGTVLATAAEGIPFRFLSGNQPNESTGRLLKYNPRTKQVTVLLAGLASAIGPAVSANNTFVLVSEYQLRRLQKFYLTGPKANTSEVFLNLPGSQAKLRGPPQETFGSRRQKSGAGSGAHNPNGAEV
ncbi:unnamed protein product [Camellia sinensis]